MIYSTFQKRPYLSRLLLALIFVIGVLEMIVAANGALPERYDWILGCLLFGTTLAWMGAAALAGVTAPISQRTMKYACRVLLVFLIVSIAPMVASMALYQLSGGEQDGLTYSTVLMALILWAWMTLAGLIGSLAPRDTSTMAYTLLVICPLITGMGVMVYLLMTMPGVPLPDESVGFPLLGLYGLAVFLLFRVLLSRLKWTRRLRSGLLLVPAVASTLVLTILTLWGVGWMSDVRTSVFDLRTSVLFGVVILAPFGVVTLRALRSEQSRERQLRDLMIAVVALGIAMASYWVIVLVSFVLGTVILYSVWALMLLLPIMAGIVVAIPLGRVISRMRHPYRNMLVAAIGPGLVMTTTMCLYWFSGLQKGI